MPARSEHWPAVRAAHLKREPTCCVCGQRDRLNVHHIQPYHLFPDLELIDTNLITLCEGESVNCHLLVGHLMAWPSFNPRVRADAELWHLKIKTRPNPKGEPSDARGTAPEHP